MSAIRGLLILFYEANRFAMNFYWVIYLWFLFTGKVNLFAHLIGFVCFLYFVSNVAYYLPS
ncbi:hypothetical protein CMO89_00895 [Candidatus Woesearchaeota archaeon]|nr:hypothetical protein [Candidatus Woesearchaeota archaeon]